MSSFLLYAQMSKFIVVKLLLSESQALGGRRAALSIMQRWWSSEVRSVSWSGFNIWGSNNLSVVIMTQSWPRVWVVTSLDVIRHPHSHYKLHWTFYTNANTTLTASLNGQKHEKKSNKLGIKDPFLICIDTIIPNYSSDLTYISYHLRLFWHLVLILVLWTR